MFPVETIFGTRGRTSLLPQILGLAVPMTTTRHTVSRNAFVRFVKMGKLTAKSELCWGESNWEIDVLREHYSADHMASGRVAGSH